MRKMLSRAAGASVVGAALVLTGFPGMAQAATTKCSYDGTDRACATNHDGGNSQIEVCDWENDGKTVQLQWAYSNGVISNFYDTYGGPCTGSASERLKVAWFQIRESGGSWQPTVFMY